MDTNQTYSYVDDFWEQEILPSLSDYIKIPNKSPMFDKAWESNGFMAAAAEHMLAWVERQAVPGLVVEQHQLPGRTPTLLLEYVGRGDNTVLVYGHLDKQPEFTGWDDGLGPWQAVRREDKLYGRGGADDGYAIYAAIAALKSLIEQALPLPRILILIEASEESGSPDLPFYMEALAARIGKPELVIALDSTCGNYDQLWLTTSLRGLLAGNLAVRVLEQGAHSGSAGGIVASSFRIMRQLLSRIENETTGDITPSFLNEQIPAVRRHEAAVAGKVLAGEFDHLFTYAGDSGPMTGDPVEQVLNNTWLASLEITGIDGIPDLESAGNVLRPYTTVKFSLRLPPTTRSAQAEQELVELLTGSAPNHVEVSVDVAGRADGWDAPPISDALEGSLEAASNAFFGAPVVSMGCGGSIPFMEFLADSFPEAQFVVTGLLGPMSNAHGPNEFLHIPTAKKLTACIAKVIYDWGQARGKASATARP